MEALLNAFGSHAVWPVWVAISLPLALAGIALRRYARRRADRVALAQASRRRLRDVSAGAVTVSGRWRRLDQEAGRGVVEDEGGGDLAARVLVECDDRDAAGLDEGDSVLVSGWATHRAPSPIAVGYREAADLWVVDARGPGQRLTPRLDALERDARTARLLGRAGGLLFAAGLAAAVGSAVIAHRAGRDEEAVDEAGFVDPDSDAVEER